MEDAKLISQLNKDWKPGKIKVKKAGGQTNRNYIVQCKNEKFFVRFPWERTDIVNREAEAKNILAIAKCKKLVGVVPKYFLYVFKGKNILSLNEKLNFPDGTAIMEYIEGKSIDGKDLKKTEIQNSLIKTIYNFHSSGVKFVNNYDVFRDEILKYKNKAKKYQIEKLLAKKELKEIEGIEEEVKNNFPLGGGVSTHNDLIFDNLFLGKNGKIYLLDFEYGGYNVRQGIYYDLGIILGGNLFQKNSIKIKTFKEILEKAKKIYGRNLNKKKIYFGALINILVMFWWGMIKYFSSANSEEKKYFRDYVLKRARGIKFLRNFIKKRSASYKDCETL
ncbi:MAG: phosphotransferase [Patescibacteria group bacterium]